MPTSTERASGLSPTVAAAPIQVNLTAAGWVVVVMMIASVFIAGSSRIAVGFLIPLGVALFIDMYLSWYFLSRQRLTILPSRTVTHQPDGIPLRLTPTGTSHPVRVTIAFGAEEQAIGLNDEPVTIEVRNPFVGATDFVRADVACSIFGLGTAHQWQTHSLAMLHWAPAPGTERIPTPDAVDEVARLRTYVPGDRMSRVSWPVTARTGQMHVRAAGEGHEEFTVVVNVDRVASAESTDPESAPSRAATLVAQLLEDGHQVRLVTTEFAQHHRDVLRAHAIENPRLNVPPAELSPERVVVDRFVTDEDDLARRLALAVHGPTVTWPYGTWVDVSSTGIQTLP